MSPDERAIRDLVDTWMKASRAGDAATVPVSYTHLTLPTILRV